MVLFAGVLLVKLVNIAIRPGHKKACKAAQKARKAAAAGAVDAVAATADQLSFEQQQPTCCDHCGSAPPPEDLLLCLGCHAAYYCGEACQLAAWWVACCLLVWLVVF